LLQGAAQSADWDVGAGLARNCDGASLARMTVLPMTSPGAGQPPSVVFENLDQLPDLHDSSIDVAQSCLVPFGSSTLSKPWRRASPSSDAWPPNARVQQRGCSGYYGA